MMLMTAKIAIELLVLVQIVVDLIAQLIAHHLARLEAAVALILRHWRGRVEVGRLALGDRGSFAHLALFKVQIR